jgi:predicted aspartyl protease
MGLFVLTVTLFPREAGSPRPVEAVVDTGTRYSIVPRPILDVLGCRLIRMQPVMLPDGRTDEWPLTLIEIECAGRRTPTPVLMGPADGRMVLGAVTLGELGLGVDPAGRRLVPVVAAV